jgi:Crinkler effector protein N-terminal domain
VSIGPQLDHRNLELNCFVFGDDASQVFPVKIASTDSVGTLRKAIKEEKKPVLDHLTADSLTLWKVSIPVDHGFKENARKVEVRDEEALSPVQKLSQIFLDQPEDGHLHIIVRCPPPNSKCEYFVVSGASNDRISELISSRLKSVPPSAYKGDPVAKGREEWATNFPQKAPSDKGKPKSFASDQRRPVPAFRFNRPPTTDATIPITLYNPIFGQFQDDCKTYIPTKEDHDFALKLSLSMSNFYNAEKGRAEKARDDFGEYGLNFLATQIDGYTTDGDLRWEKFCLALIEMKPELCFGNAEPLFQAAWYYVAFTRNQLQANLGSHLPCFILYAAGECTCVFRHVHQVSKFIS